MTKKHHPPPQPRRYEQQDAAGALQRLRAAQQAGVLGLSRCQLAVLPEAVASLAAAVRVVDASHNLLRAIPPDLAQLQRLVVLNLSGNRLERLPQGGAVDALPAAASVCREMEGDGWLVDAISN